MAEKHYLLDELRKFESVEFAIGERMDVITKIQLTLDPCQKIFYYKSV